MDKTEISLLLSTLSALAVFFGPIGALVITAFVAGFIVGRRRSSDGPRAL